MNQKCHECVWYVITREPTEEEKRMVRLYGVTLNLRSCALGGCLNFERFEGRGESDA